jgi:predicted metal-binding membrane protein
MMTLGWVPMMAAMMLPSALPAITRRVREHDGVMVAPRFAGMYLGIWLLAGLAVYALYRPPGDVTAGVLVVAGGLYELTPFKRACRLRCRQRQCSAPMFGAACVGSSLGFVAILAGADPMSGAWMCAIAAIVVAQKLLPPRPALDAPLAVGLVGVALL